MDYRDSRISNNGSAAKETFEVLKVTFSQLQFIRRLIEDCKLRLVQSKDFENWKALDREFNELQREWGFLHDKFVTLNERLNLLLNPYAFDQPNPDAVVCRR
jgi:hypothetical protein